MLITAVLLIVRKEAELKMESARIYLAIRGTEIDTSDVFIDLPERKEMCLVEEFKTAVVVA